MEKRDVGVIVGFAIGALMTAFYYYRQEGNLLLVGICLIIAVPILGACFVIGRKIRNKRQK